MSEEGLALWATLPTRGKMLPYRGGGELWYCIIFQEAKLISAIKYDVDTTKARGGHQGMSCGVHGPPI